MNETLVKALANQKKQQERFAEQGADQIYRTISNNASRVATQLFSEGSVHLSMGLFLTEEDIEQLRRETEALRLRNEQCPLGRPPSSPATN